MAEIRRALVARRPDGPTARRPDGPTSACIRAFTTRARSHRSLDGCARFRVFGLRASANVRPAGFARTPDAFSTVGCPPSLPHGWMLGSDALPQAR
jgi:hypothetical protein